MSDTTAPTGRTSTYFTTAEVAERFRAATETVRYWRSIGYGPKSIKVGRRVLYPVAAVEAFEQELLGEAK